MREMSVVNLVTYMYSIYFQFHFEALNGTFEAQIFEGSIFKPYQRHW